MRNERLYAASDVPLLEDDRSGSAVIEPAEIFAPIDIPARVVLCFFSEVLDAIAARGDATKVKELVAAHGTHAIWEVEHRSRRLAVLNPGVGAALAAGFLEETIALGARTIVAVGGAGALVPDLVLGHAVVVESAVRDEGTSFHYLPPSRVVAADAAGVEALQQTLTAAGVPFVTGRTWTTDALYRETRGRVRRRVAEQCVTVEMEAAALIAVAQYGVRGSLSFSMPATRSRVTNGRSGSGRKPLRSASNSSGTRQMPASLWSEAFGRRGLVVVRSAGSGSPARRRQSW